MPTQKWPVSPALFVVSGLSSAWKTITCSETAKNFSLPSQFYQSVFFFRNLTLFRVAPSHELCIEINVMILILSYQAFCKLSFKIRRKAVTKLLLTAMKYYWKSWKKYLAFTILTQTTFLSFWWKSLLNVHRLAHYKFPRKIMI